MKPLRLFAVMAVVALGGLGAAGTARSEQSGVHVNLTPFGGYWDWSKKVNLDNKALYGGQLGLGLGPYIGLEGYYSWMSDRTGYGLGDSLFVPTGGSQSPRNDVKVKGYGADLIVNLLPAKTINPYILGGWHEEKLTPKNLTYTLNSYKNGLEFGGGVKIGVAPRLAIRAEVRDKLWKFDSPPAPDNGSNNNLVYTGGLQFTLGGTGGDSDKDGVPNNKDRCPGTPLGAKVDASGCPLDSDGDHVPDGLDQCPDTPQGAIVDARGCPKDADGDGVPDGIDQCADTPKGVVVDARGCPKDSDQDGIPDGVDKCADTPAGAKVDATGCPIDTDQDGVPDGLDQCMNTPIGVKVDAHGCPVDSDQDGVPDDKDKCPNTLPNVKVDSDGCPIELSEKETELLDKGRITTREIHFETAKFDILPESETVLDDLGKILIQWPQLRIEVGGHADARGSDAYNTQLTQKRAQSVLDWLTAHYPQINKDQYTAVGYGKSKPVASNKTVEGMAKNRRVEFKVLNTEELKKEKERRRLMQKGE